MPRNQVRHTHVCGKGSLLQLGHLSAQNMLFPFTEWWAILHNHWRDSAWTGSSKGSRADGRTCHLYLLKCSYSYPQIRLKYKKAVCPSLTGVDCKNLPTKYIYFVLTWAVIKVHSKKTTVTHTLIYSVFAVLVLKCPDIKFPLGFVPGQCWSPLPSGFTSALEIIRDGVYVRCSHRCCLNQFSHLQLGENNIHFNLIALPCFHLHFVPLHLTPTHLSADNSANSVFSADTCQAPTICQATTLGAGDRAVIRTSQEPVITVENLQHSRRQTC